MKAVSTKTAALQKELDHLLTSGDIRKMFNVSAQSIHVWRTQRGLPAIVIKSAKRPAVRFVKKDVVDWARRNKLTVRSI